MSVAEELIKKITRAPQVLLLESAPGIALSLKDTMEHEFNCKVSWRQNADIDCASLENYDIIFVDAELPLLRNLLQQLRQNAPYVPVVLITDTNSPQRLDGTISVFPRESKTVANLDQIFGQYKLRVNRRPHLHLAAPQ